MIDDQTGLRPIERVIIRLQADGQTVPEIASRIGKRPGTVERILAMIELREDSGTRPSSGSDSGLRPLERVVLRMLADGLSYGEVANRVGRSGAQVRRIEGYARLKLAG